MGTIWVPGGLEVAFSLNGWSPSAVEKGSYVTIMQWKLLKRVKRAAWAGYRAFMVQPEQLRGVRSTEINGLQFHLNLDEHTHRRIYQRKEFEPELTAVLLRCIGPNAVFYDIGANFGWHTINVLGRHRDARSYSFEPSRSAYKLLQAGLEANGLTGRATCHQMGLSSSPGEATLHTFVGEYLGGVNASFYPLGDSKSTTESVPLATLDSVVEENGAWPTVIKCDVEGSELDVLRGAKNVLSGKKGEPPLWFLETNYETSGMAGFFPWQLLEEAQKHADYEGFYVRDGRVKPLPSKAALRHGDCLVLGVPSLHASRF